LTIAIIIGISCNLFAHKANAADKDKITKDTYGVVEAVSIGTTKIIVSYPKIKSIELTDNVVETGSIDKKGTNQKVIDKAEKLYDTKLETSNMVNYYRTFDSLSDYDFSNSNHDIIDVPIVVCSSYTDETPMDADKYYVCPMDRSISDAMKEKMKAPISGYKVKKNVNGNRKGWYHWVLK